MIRVNLTVAVLLLVALGPMTRPASAITVELAKKCETLTAKAFPPRVVGNPAAGSKKGSAGDERAYFNKCVENNGKTDDSGAAQTK
jgi:hypothetical protein